MLFQFLYSLFYFPIVLSLNEGTLKFSVDYFKTRNVKFACLLLCQNDSWTLKFEKLAANFGIATSKVTLKGSDGNITNEGSIVSCLRGVYPTGVLADPLCPEYPNILNLASLNMFFDSIHKWLIVDEGFFRGSTGKYETMNLSNQPFNGTVNGAFNGANTFMGHENIRAIFNYSWAGVDVWSKLNLSVDADVMWAAQKDENSFELVEVFNFGKIQGGKVILNEIGEWNDRGGSSAVAKLNEYRYYRRWDFNQWTMRMIISMTNPPKEFNPGMVLGDQQYPGVAEFTKIATTVLNIVAEMHNFRFKYLVADRWIGEFHRNSNTVSSALYYRDQDISVAIRFIKIVHDRIDLLHPPLTEIETRYYYRIPTNGPGRLENQFLRPLSPGAWGCVLALTTLCALVLMAAARVERRPSSAQYALFSVVASICQQFFEDAGENGTKGKSTARKLTIFVTGLSCMLVFNYYTSSVVSWLLNGPPPSINSLQELLASPLELVLEDVGYSRSWLQTPTYYFNKRFAKMEDELRKQKIFNKKKGSLSLMSVENGIQLVKAGGYTFHTETAAANRLISRTFTQSELCELGSLQSMEVTKLYPCVQKNSPYKEFFVWSLMRLKERGLVSRVQQRISFSKVGCAGVTPRALSLGGAAPVFLLLTFGYLLATVIMIIERIVAARDVGLIA